MHVPHEGLGGMESWFVGRGHALGSTRFDRGDTPPPVEDIDWLVVMGGPMGVYEESRHPWLLAEKAFIRAALARDMPVLGVCLGAQLLAEALGAEVRANAQREIGWYPVETTAQAAESALGRLLPPRFTPLHWHGDTFELPPGAVHLARSAACVNQAFAFEERVLGLQFHLEALPSVTAAFWEADREQLGEGEYVQRAPEILGTPAQYAALQPLQASLLEALESVARPQG
jgi:GMP synthase-like glutamine amidotransferase